MLRTIKLGETDRIVTILTQGTARSGPSPRACASRGAGSAPGSSRRATSRSSATGAERARRRHPGRDHRRQPRRCASTTAVSPTRSRCSRPSTRSPRSASRTPRCTGCWWGRCARWRPTPSPLVSAAFFWKLLSLEGFHPMLDACARCGDEAGSVHRVRPRRRGRALRDVRASRRPADRSPRRWRSSAGSSAASCDARSAEPPSRDHVDVERLALAALEHHLERRLRSAALL